MEQRIEELPVIELANIENKISNVEPILKDIENPILDEIQFDNLKPPATDMVTIEINTSEKEEESSLKIIHKLANDQDTTQRINVAIQVLLELYRVITSSLLILFVPQICDDHICTTTENLVWETSTYNTALCFNFISMALLLNMYYML